MPDAPFLARQERFPSVGSTNDVVRAWLAEGTPEVCLAVADEQTAGRGRAGRTWQAPTGAALLLSLGFRPTWMALDKVWRLAATVSLAMADAAEEVAGLPDGAIRLKWPNDLVIEMTGAIRAGLEDLDAEAAAAAAEAAATSPPAALKLAGVLGESEGLGSDDPRVVVGIGVNAGWPATDFPTDLAPTMTSLHEASRGRPIDLSLLLDGFLGRLEVRIAALRAGRFDLADWNVRQVTTGRDVEIQLPDGSIERARALGVDAASGGLVVAEGAAGAGGTSATADAHGAGERTLLVGEIRHVRLATPAAAGV